MDTRPISAMTFVAATLIFALLLWLVHRCVACYLAYLDVASHALEDDSEEI